MTIWRNVVVLWLLGLIVMAAAQESDEGRIAVTYRDGGSAQAAVVSLSDGSLLFDSANSTTESGLPVLEAYAWQLSRDGNILLMGRLTPLTITSELVRHDIESGEELVISPPVEGELITSTAQLTETGDEIVFQYRAQDATDHRNLQLGIWRGDSSRHFIGDATLSTVAFALSTEGTVAYVALPLTDEAGAARIYVTDTDGNEPRQVASLPTDLPLAINPLATHMSISDDGHRVTLSIAEESAASAPTRYRSFGINTETGEVLEFGSPDASLSASSLSPDGIMVALFGTDTRSIALSSFDQPLEQQPLSPPLEVAPERGVTWSPAGNHIVYGGVTNQGGLQAFTAGIGDSDPAQVTSFDQGLWNTSFSWGHNGR